MPVILLVAACCAVPLAIGVGMVRSWRKREKVPELDNRGPIQVEQER